MRTLMKVGFISLGLLCLTVSSCATYRANMFLLNETTPQKKADLLVDEGKSRYAAEILEKDNAAELPKIRQFFTDALELDPLNPEAQKYINAIDSYKQKKFDSYKATAKKLFALEKRTPAQDYDLVYAAKMAADLNKTDKDVGKITAAIKGTRTAVIGANETDLAAVLGKIAAEKDQQTVLKQIREANRLATRLNKIDPGNKNAGRAQESITSKTETFVQKDIDAAAKFLSAKKYSDAEDAILRAEKNFAAVSQKPDAKVTTLKYQIYYDWSLSLYKAKQYQSAGDRIANAIRTNRTQEAIALKTKIDKAASVHDFDADIADILSSVDARLAKDDTTGAMALIDDNLAKLKVQSNKDKLSAKKDAVAARLKSLYQDAISLYNEEDYESARQKFRAVIATDAGYEQAQAYLDRTETKIRALEGND